MSDEDPGVGLAAMIKSLRSELEEAVAASAGSDLLFGLGPIELELEVGVGTEKGADGGVKFWVVTLGGQASKTTDRTQRITLTLSPRRHDDPDADMYVSRVGALSD